MTKLEQIMHREAELQRRHMRFLSVRKHRQIIRNTAKALLEAASYIFVPRDNTKAGVRLGRLDN